MTCVKMFYSDVGHILERFYIIIMVHSHTILPLSSEFLDFESSFVTMPIIHEYIIIIVYAASQFIYELFIIILVIIDYYYYTINRYSVADSADSDDGAAHIIHNMQMAVCCFGCTRI